MAMHRTFSQLSKQPFGKILLISLLFSSGLGHFLIDHPIEQKLTNFPAGNDLNGEHKQQNDM